MNLNRVMCRKATEILTGQTYDEGGDREVKICYSLENIVDDLEKVLILLVLFGVAGRLPECIVCYVVVCLTRVYMGGIHMRTWLGCTLMTVGVHVCAVWCGEWVDLSMAWIWIFVAVLSLMLSVAPISSPQRPIYVGWARWKIKSKGILGILISFVGFCVLDNFSNYILWVLLLEVIEVMCLEIFRWGHRFIRMFI